MERILTRRSLLVVGLLTGVILLLGPSTARAQDDKVKVEARFFNMATAAEMMKLGETWDVTECCGWIGTWRRRPNTNIFDAKWKHTNGTPVADSVELKSWNKTTNEITLYRASNKGTYRAFVANGGASLVRGTTSFYPPGATWSADIDLDVKGKVNFIRR